MRRRFLAGIAGVAMLAAITVAPVAASGQSQAAPARAVHIEVQTSGFSGGLSGGPFTATGPAVDAGLICPAGDTIDAAGASASGYQSGRAVNLTVVKHFTCPDGDFWIKLQVRLDARGDHFTWGIVDGTGVYAQLHGAGTGYGDYEAYPGGVLDVYDGVISAGG